MSGLPWLHKRRTLETLLEERQEAMMAVCRLPEQLVGQAAVVEESRPEVALAPVHELVREETLKQAATKVQKLAAGRSKRCHCYTWPNTHPQRMSTGAGTTNAVQTLATRSSRPASLQGWLQKRSGSCRCCWYRETPLL